MHQGKGNEVVLRKRNPPNGGGSSSNVSVGSFGLVPSRSSSSSPSPSPSPSSSSPAALSHVPPASSSSSSKPHVLSQESYENPAYKIGFEMFDHITNFLPPKAEKEFFEKEERNAVSDASDALFKSLKKAELLGGNYDYAQYINELCSSLGILLTKIKLPTATHFQNFWQSPFSFYANPNAEKEMLRQKIEGAIKALQCLIPGHVVSITSLEKEKAQLVEANKALENAVKQERMAAHFLREGNNPYRGEVTIPIIPPATLYAATNGSNQYEPKDVNALLAYYLPPETFLLFEKMVAQRAQLVRNLGVESTQDGKLKIQAELHNLRAIMLNCLLYNAPVRYLMQGARGGVYDEQKYQHFKDDEKESIKQAWQTRQDILKDRPHYLNLVEVDALTNSLRNVSQDDTAAFHGQQFIEDALDEISEELQQKVKSSLQPEQVEFLFDCRTAALSAELFFKNRQSNVLKQPANASKTPVCQLYNQESQQCAWHFNWHKFNTIGKMVERNAFEYLNVHNTDKDAFQAFILDAACRKKYFAEEVENHFNAPVMDIDSFGSWRGDAEIIFGALHNLDNQSEMEEGEVSGYVEQRQLVMN